MGTNEMQVDSPRYGDFPELFWDAEPAVLIDVANPSTLARILMRANAQTVGRLVPPEVLRKELDTLQIPEHTRTFWQRVIQHVPEAKAGRTRRPA